MYHQNNYMADSKGKYYWDTGVKVLILQCSPFLDLSDDLIAKEDLTCFCPKLDSICLSFFIICWLSFMMSVWYGSFALLLFSVFSSPCSSSLSFCSTSQLPLICCFSWVLASYMEETKFLLKQGNYRTSLLCWTVLLRGIWHLSMGNIMFKSAENNSWAESTSRSKLLHPNII